MAEDESKPEVANEDEEKSGSGPLMGVLAFLMALGLGVLGGRLFQDDLVGPPVLDDDTRYDVELRGDEPAMGADDPLVTIIEFADYQCPYCAQAREPLEKALGKFDEDVRLIYKHFPLPGHRMATPAAKAAWAALQQDKFWEMHADLFEAKASVKEIGARAASMGMDEAKFLRDFASTEASQAVDSDLLAGAKLGVTGTPVFFVNGHRYVGFRDTSQWTDVLEFEIENAERLVDAGTARAQVYATLMKDAVKNRRSKKASEPVAAKPGGLDPNVLYPVDVDGRPTLGPADALVTVAVFSDFQCPYCGRIAPTLKELVEVEKDVRVVFMQLPIRSHPRARDAAKAALAAGRQDKFWEMHDLLFERRAELNKADFATFAAELGLDAEAFAADVADVALEGLIVTDEALARSLKIASTPSTFVNGHYVRGAVPLKTLRAKVAEQRAVAQALVDAGTPAAGVYAALMADAVVPSP
ncbi:MAG: thioredoxin domain-containing protein [Myxococcota bacterium]